VQLFTGGLLPPLSHAVRIHNPTTLAAAMSLARQVELMELERPPVRQGARGLLPPSPPRPALAAPPQQLALPNPPAGNDQGRREGNQRRLSTAEQAERRRLGLCFNCDEKYSRGHNRFCKRIFFVDGVEIDDTEPVTDDGDRDAPCFSLQAVVGVSMTNTTQLAVTLGAAQLVALFDSGSTHNFISEEAARRSGLPLQQCPRLTAMVANGEKITCAGVIRKAPLFIAGAAFPAELFVMPLAGYDIVLGTKWLGALGPIVWDLANRRMSFQRGGRTIAWAGLSTTSGPAVCALSAEESLLDALLGAFARVFATPTGLPPKRAHDHRILLKLDA
jgi:hypothetical protein